jgi:AcrR family transcriptional regulator
VDARRAELIELGFELFRTYAYDSLSVEQIAVHARISKGLLYHYFQSKREYYLQVVRALAEEFVVSARKLIHLGATEQLDAGLDEFLDYARSRRALIEGLMRGAFGTADEVSKIIEITRREIVDGLLADLGEQTPSMRNALRGWVQFAERTIMAWVDHEEVAKPELRRLLLATALHAMELARAAQQAEAPSGVIARRESPSTRGAALESIAGSV